MPNFSPNGSLVAEFTQYKHTHRQTDTVILIDKIYILAFIPNFVWAYNYIQIKFDFMIFKLNIMHTLWIPFY